jgi:ABC-type sugar transport system ATPase subunit
VAARLEIRGLNKAFAAPVLWDVSLSVAPGEIRGLVGENGAGKSTLVNIVSGILRRDAGEILLDGIPFNPRRPRDAALAGIAVASQELSLVDTLPVSDNLLLRRLPSRLGVVATTEANAASAALLELVGLDLVRPETPVAALSLSERQLLEFAKAIAQPSRLLILDEPTAALTAPQAERLHAIVKAKAAEGTAIIYVSHRLGDVLAVCHRVSVLRDGRITRNASTDEITVPEMIAEMSGRDPRAEMIVQDRKPSRAGEAVLALRQATTAALPHPIDLEIYGGEILGVAGLAGAGRTELLEALYAMAPLRAGSVMLRGGGEPGAIGSPHKAVKGGVGMLSEDRKASGIFAGQSVGFNMSLPALKTAVAGIVDRRREQADVETLIAALGIRCSGAGQDIVELSGGNQQKALFARWIMRGVSVLLLDEPTRGVDVVAKFDIHAEIRNLAAAGCAIVVVSSEMEELTALADRIVVLSARKIVAEFTERPWDEGRILAAAFSAHVAARGVQQDGDATA